jgi:exodeoxyribonuclease VII large subunit
MEMLVRRRRQQVDELSSSLAIGLRLRLGTTRQRLTRAGARITSFDLRARAVVLRRRIEYQRGALYALLDRVVVLKRRRLTEAQMRLARIDFRSRVGRLRHSFEQRFEVLRARISDVLNTKRRRVESASLQLNERSPFQLLERGYAIAYDASGKVLRSPDQVALGEDISVRLARGQLDATVRGRRNSIK